ncbi:MAG: hypothetical protein AB1609_18965 [Bacillota bacterium]
MAVRQDRRDSERPVVRLLADARNRPVEPQELALADAPEVEVALVLDSIPEQVRQALASRGGER